jgi:predicted MPP superfamily phosphohydrolase
MRPDSQADSHAHQHPRESGANLPADFPDPPEFDTPEPTGPLTRRRFLLGTAAAVGGFGLYSNQIARHEIDITHVDIPLRDLPDSFHGLRIVQISDLHLEEFTEEYFLRRIVRHVNALAPDVVLVTGDFISNGPRSPAFSLRSAVRCGEILAGLTCPLRFGCLGNHDASVGGPQVAERIAPSGIKVLINAHIPLERGPHRLWLAGIDDPARGTPDIGLTIPKDPGAPVLLMAHEPDYIDDIYYHRPQLHRPDLILSGHSHGGQIRAPWGTPPALPPGAIRFYEGLYPVKNNNFPDTLLYVNRGIGTVGVPFRLNCPPEITVLTLKSV